MNYNKFDAERIEVDANLLLGLLKEGRAAEIVATNELGERHVAFKELAEDMMADAEVVDVPPKGKLLKEPNPEDCAHENTFPDNVGDPQAPHSSYLCDDCGAWLDRKKSRKTGQLRWVVVG